MKGIGIVVFMLLFFYSMIFDHFLFVQSYDTNQFMEHYPTPNTKHNRVMGLVLAFNHYHIDPLFLIFNEYVSMCEAGWDPTVVLFTTVNWSERLLRYLRQKTYCYRISKSIEIRTSQFDPSINIALGAQHRPYVAKEIDNYDVFIYHEDDMVFKLSHLSGYLHETKQLHKLLPQNGLTDHCIGFQRYRRIQNGNDIRIAHTDTDIIELEFLEELPNFVPTCIKDQPYLRVDGNIHQAIWMFTRQQLLFLQEKCSFFNQSSPSREYMSSFSVFDHKAGHCGLTKLLPAERLVTFSILHYFQQRHVSWTPLFNSDENIRAGFHYMSAMDSRSPAGMPDCWKEIVERARKEQANSTATTDIKHVNHHHRNFSIVHEDNKEESN